MITPDGGWPTLKDDGNGPKGFLEVIAFIGFILFIIVLFGVMRTVLPLFFEGVGSIPSLFPIAGQLILHAKTSLRGKAIAVVTIYVMAMGLYQLKKRSLLNYGRLEWLVGLLLTMYSVSKIEPDVVSALAAMGGGIYLMIRAFDNLNKGRRVHKRRKARTALYGPPKPRKRMTLEDVMLKDFPH